MTPRSSQRWISPQEAAVAWDRSRSTTVTTTAGTVTQLVQAESSRIVLGIANVSGNTVFVTPARETVSGLGFLLAANSFPLILDYAHFGGMVQSQWFCSGSFASQIYVYEFMIRDRLAVEEALQ